MDMEINISARRTGKSHLMIKTIATEIVTGGRVGVAGLKSPDPIIKQLRDLGIDAKYEKMTYTTPLRAILDWPEGLLGWEGGETKDVGYVFYK